MNPTQKRKMMQRMRKLLKEYGYAREGMGYHVTEEAIAEDKDIADAKKEELVGLWQRILEL